MKKIVFHREKTCGTMSQKGGVGVPESIGERLKQLRKQHNMTLEEVANYLNIGRPTVYKYETGSVASIPSDKIEMLARLYNVSPAYIMGWSEDPACIDERNIPIIVPDSERFVKLVRYMPTDDYVMVMKAFERAEERLREEEEQND